MPNKTETVEIQKFAKIISLMYLFHREEFTIQEQGLKWSPSLTRREGPTELEAQHWGGPVDITLHIVSVTLLLLKVLSSCSLNGFLP